MMSRPQHRRRISGHLALALTGVVLITISACAQAGRHSDDDGVPAVPAADRPPRAFLTLAVTKPVFDRSGANLLRYPVESLQLRSISNGRVIRMLLRSLGQIDAVSASNGSVLAAVDYGCRSQLFHIDPATGLARLIRVVPDSVQDIALSPDGSRLAYDTDPKSTLPPCQPVRQPRHPVRTTLGPDFDISGPATTVTAIVNLASGATVSAQDRGGNPTWSPDGTRIAVVSPNNLVVQLSAAKLRPVAAQALRSAAGCDFRNVAWTRSGLIASVGCAIENDPRRPYLDEASLTGKTLARLRLPRCTADVATAVAGKNVLVEADLGYGYTRPCGFPRAGGYALKFLLLRGAGFTTVGTLPKPSGFFFLLGW